MQVLLGVPFGLLGVAVATPLTTVMYVLIVMLYIQEVLGDSVPTPSERSALRKGDVEDDTSTKKK